MTDVFISYSRKDSGFMETVFEALQAREVTSWADWSDIRKGENWLDAIYDGIETADTFVFIVSPDSLKSEVCNKEIAHARAHNKRIIPIIRREVEIGGQMMTDIITEWYDKSWEQDARQNWQAIQNLNWLFFREDDSFDSALDTLIKALRTDHRYVHTHTRFLTRALQWEKNNRSSSILLMGEELAQAQSWLHEAEVDDKAPPPTDLHKQYIAFSREEAIRQAQQAKRRRVAFTVLGTLTLTALLIAGGIYLISQRKQQENERNAQATGVVQATHAWEATTAGLVDGRNQTLVAGLGMVPPVTQSHVPQNFVATLTRVAGLTDWIPEMRTVDGVEMVRVPAGCFWMGSTEGFDEQPVTEICFEEDFWIDRYEVTNEQFARLDGDAARETCSSGDQAPRTCLSWFEAQMFCADRRDARLPREDEWEYAARGPDSVVFPWGNDFDDSKVVYAGNAAEPLAVGSRSEAGGDSWIGAADMSGNVWEWVSSLYLEYPYIPDESRENPDDAFSPRVMRGGSFIDSGPENLRAALRLNDMPDYADTYLGFRCARAD